MPSLDHLALAVRDPHCSLRFYRDLIGVEGDVHDEEYGFVITTPSGLAFTLLQGDPPADTGEFHIGVSVRDGDEVRKRREMLRAREIPEVEWVDEADYVSVKVRDPDGYLVEIAWDAKYPPS